MAVWNPLACTDQIVSTATHSPRILFARSFKAYIAGLSCEGSQLSAPSVARLVEQSAEFHAIRARIREKFVDDFADAEDFVVVYDVYVHRHLWRTRHSCDVLCVVCLPAVPFDLLLGTLTLAHLAVCSHVLCVHAQAAAHP